MKVTIIKFLSSKGKILEMRKDNFKGRDLPENIIEEYEVEIKGEDSNEIGWLEELKRKYTTGNYILLTPSGFSKEVSWIMIKTYPFWDCDNYKLIHNKHKDIIEAYLKNPSVEIETGMFAPMTGETEPSKWVKLEKDFIEDYNEEFWYRLKVKDLAWYEDENMVGKMIYDGLNKEYGLVLKIKDNLIETSLDRKYSFSEINSHQLRPATESEVLSLVYKPQQELSKEINLTESNRLKDLFLKNEAECLVENEQEFKEVYDFLDKTCDKSLRRWTPQRGKIGFYDRFPLLILCDDEWNNIFEYNLLKYRDKNKPLIKYSNGIFSLVEQGDEI